MKKLVLSLTVIMILLIGINSVNAELTMTGQYSPSDSALGIGSYTLNNEKIGFYGNFQLSCSDRTERYEISDLSKALIVDHSKEVFIINGGLTKKLNRYIGVYTGIGYAKINGTMRKSNYILSSDGHYYLHTPSYINDPSVDDGGLNVNIGFLIFVKKLTIEIGANTFIKNVYFGLGIRF